MNTLPSKSLTLRNSLRSHAFFGKARQLVDTVVALNVVIAACFAAVGGFFDLAANEHVNVIALLVLFLTTWQIYIADRLGKHPEDDASDIAAGSVSSEITQTH